MDPIRFLSMRFLSKRLLLAGVLALSGADYPVSAQSFRVATWQAGELLLPPEPGKPAQANPERVQAVATALGGA